MKRALLFLLLVTFSAQAGDRGGTGGDPLAADFVARGHFLVSSLQTGADRGLLAPPTVVRFEEALRTARVEFVDSALPNGWWQVVDDPTDPKYRLIQVYRADWKTSVRLNVDLLRPVFQAYLKAIDVSDEGDRLVDKLKLNERDYQNRARVSPDCPTGRFEPVKITFTLASHFDGLRSPLYINGADFDPGDRTSHRTFNSQRLCTTVFHKWIISVGSFTRELELRGGERVILEIPGGKLVRE